MYFPKNVYIHTILSLKAQTALCTYIQNMITLYEHTTRLLLLYRYSIIRHAVKHVLSYCSGHQWSLDYRYLEVCTYLVPSSLPTNFTLIFLERYGTLQLLFGNRPKLKKKNLKRCALMPPRSLMMMIRRRRQLHGFLIGHGCLCLEKWLKPSLKPTIIPHEGDEEDTLASTTLYYIVLQNLEKFKTWASNFSRKLCLRGANLFIFKNMRQFIFCTIFQFLKQCCRSWCHAIISYGCCDETGYSIVFV